VSDSEPRLWLRSSPVAREPFQPFAMCDSCGAAKLKKGSSCGTRLPRSRFHVDATKTDRLSTRCDTCAALKNHREQTRRKLLR
jgi:hypothetical protein